MFTEAKNDRGGGDNWTTGAISRATSSQIITTNKLTSSLLQCLKYLNTERIYYFKHFTKLCYLSSMVFNLGIHLLFGFSSGNVRTVLMSCVFHMNCCFFTISINICCRKINKNLHHLVIQTSTVIRLCMKTMHVSRR